MARWAAFINRHHNAEANWLTIDAGNYVDRVGARGGCSRKCQFMVTSYEGLHYDVLNIARQEVAMGYEALAAIRDTTEDTEFVSANLIDVKTGKPLFNPYVIKDYGNMRIGIIGLLRPADFPATSSTLDTTVLRAAPFLDAADEYLPAISRKADAIIVLAELPTADIEALLEAHPEIDLIISTGALKSGERLDTIGSTKIMGTGSSGYNGHWVSLEFNPEWGDSIGYDSFRDPLTDNYKEAGEWENRLAAFQGGAKTSTKARTTTINPSNTVLDAKASNQKGRDDHKGHDHSVKSISTSNTQSIPAKKLETTKDAKASTQKGHDDHKGHNH